MKLTDVRIRDPFLLAVPDERRHYLFGSTDPNTWDGPGSGFECYRTDDLEEWDGPFPAFRRPDGFWGTSQFWAPEVHRHDGAWFMLATFAGEPEHPGHAVERGTAVLRADRPEGPYLLWSDGPVTPADQVCLDGTLHVDDDGAPWLVYCREWTEVGDGQVVAQRLSHDLRCAAGPAHVLFTASGAPWTRPLADTDPGAVAGGGEAWVTDGPFLHRTATGSLVMVWSSYGASGYAVGTATSASGTVLGPWEHTAQPLWPWDGGHAMVSCDLAGRLRLVLHQPNTLGDERTQLVDLVEVAGSVRLAPLGSATATAGGPAVITAVRTEEPPQPLLPAAGGAARTASTAEAAAS